MVDPFIVHEFIYGDIEYPQEMHSDIAKFNFFARKNNMSIDELKQELERVKSRLEKTENSYYFINMWVNIASKAIEAREYIVQNAKGILDTPLWSAGNGKREYGAKMIKRKDSWIVQIVQKLTDDGMGLMTGIPNAEYWAGTPGQYYASTILGWDKWSIRSGRGTGSNSLCIDGGSNWNIYGMDDLRNEIEKKYGDEIRKELLSSSSLSANESLQDILKPKSQEEIASSFPKSWKIKEATEFLKEIGLSFKITGNESYGDYMIDIYIKEFENEIFLSYIPKQGWQVMEQFDDFIFWEGLSWYKAKRKLLELIEKFHNELKKEGIYSPLSSTS